jgi:hypothetical protein
LHRAYDLPDVTKPDATSCVRCARVKHVFNANELHHFGEEITRPTIALNAQALPLVYDRPFPQVMNL